MADTIYFLDGSHEVVFLPPGLDPEEARIAFFDRIIRERLGEDSSAVLHSIVDDLRGEKDLSDIAQDDYESTCEEYRGCMEDVWDCLVELQRDLDMSGKVKVKYAASVRKRIEHMIDLLRNEL